ncbi:succinate dehydrogenase/fumarate reductase iron-sulfur subunit [Desulfovermiculus halophilus]|jgi:succinate dehydrogenase / fumarate reductase iron-sulfur subunit|uniref:succinate dehydrogenase/fumarate reductase iron-sulfur subunit n=1 Tax=Desulfovermiculus halophilus TaxID=339722 RepID=UPI00048405D9|nr:2Fe-2S iron-sulfur cluster-binding protein [Desulfovermiculus halophilus]
MGLVDITLNIRRYDPDHDRTWWQEYAVTVGEIMRFVDVLRTINSELDPSLAWSSSCEHGQCGTCSILVNKSPVLACELLVQRAIERFETTHFQVEPLSIAPVLRDLVIDIEQAYSRVHEAKPYLIDPAPLREDESYSTLFPRSLEAFLDATRCINCFCCAQACLSSHHSFIGPNAAMASVVRLMDPRETAREERLKLLYSDRGIYRCHTSRACSFVCPKEIDVAHFLALAKQGSFDQDKNSKKG